MKKLLLFTVIVFCSLSGFSQINNIYKERKTTIGLSAGEHYTMFRYKDTSGNPHLARTLQSFNGGVLIEHELTENLLISPRLDFFITTGDLSSDKDLFVYPWFLELKVHLQYKNERSLNQLYFYAGPNYRKSLTSSDHSFMVDYEFALDFGVGFNIKDGYNISPEFRYTMGFSEINTLNNRGSGTFHSFGIIFCLKDYDLLNR